MKGDGLGQGLGPGAGAGPVGWRPGLDWATEHQERLHPVPLERDDFDRTRERLGVRESRLRPSAFHSRVPWMRARSRSVSGRGGSGSLPNMPYDAHRPADA